MDEKNSDRGKAVPSLAAALRSARTEAAERSQSVANLRGAEISRLDLLRETLEPVFAQLPEGVDMFDTGIVPGDHPRLFIDMIAFVDMGRDRRTYRFHLDTRNGRVLLAETEGVHAMAAKITDYIARRLVEREKALASLEADGVVLRPNPEPIRPAPMERRPPPPVDHPRRRDTAARLKQSLGRLWMAGVGVLVLAGLLWVGRQYSQGQLPGW